MPTWDLCSSFVAAYKLTHMFIKITFLCVSDKKLIRRIKYNKVALDLLTVGKACNVSQFLHEWVYMIDKFEFCRFLILREYLINSEMQAFSIISLEHKMLNLYHSFILITFVRRIKILRFTRYASGDFMWILILST